MARITRFPSAMIMLSRRQEKVESTHSPILLIETTVTFERARSIKVFPSLMDMYTELIPIYEITRQNKQILRMPKFRFSVLCRDNNLDLRRP